MEKVQEVHDANDAYLGKMVVDWPKGQAASEMGGREGCIRQGGPC